MQIRLTRQETVDLIAWAAEKRGLVPQGYRAHLVGGFGTVTITLVREGASNGK